jgi:GH24 family phage-related lysozyme (muramidase)
MVSNPPEPYIPRGKITWEAPKEPKEEPYTPVGNITWGSPVEETPVIEGTTSEPVTEEQRMKELDEALAREDSQNEMTSLKELLHAEEGFKSKVYQGEKDDKGVLTAGYGHKLTSSELKKYKEGDEIEQEQLDKWFEQDTKLAKTAAEKQAKSLKVEDKEFIKVLASVNFQLGINWYKEHKETWKLIKAGKYEEAALEAANSDWNDQTPDRVEVFQEALRNLAQGKEYDGLSDGFYKDPATGEKFQVKGGKRL